MKKILFLLIISTLFSCSKLENSMVNFQIVNKTNKDLHSIKYINNGIYVESKVNDSLFYTIIISTSANIATSYIVNKVLNSKKDTIYKYSKRETLSGSHIINNNIINGRYNSKNSSDFIEFKNYQL